MALHAPTPEFVGRLDSPIGRIELTSDGHNITGLAIERVGHLPWHELPAARIEIFERASLQLGEYFAGKRTAFDLPVVASGTPFQKEVWQELILLPYGEVTSYQGIGRAIGRPSGARAVGGAIGANPVPIIVPCHRVLASNGLITGYSAGEGIPTKAWLLDHEGIHHR